MSSPYLQSACTCHCFCTMQCNTIKHSLSKCKTNLLDRFSSTIPQYPCTHINQHIPEHSRPRSGHPLALRHNKQSTVAHTKVVNLSQIINKNMPINQYPMPWFQHQTPDHQSTYQDMVFYFSLHWQWYSQLAFLTIVTSLNHHSHSTHIQYLLRRVGQSISHWTVTHMLPYSDRVYRNTTTLEPSA